MGRLSALLPLLPASLATLLVSGLVAGDVEVTSRILRRDVALTGAPPVFHQQSSSSTIHCSALCLRKSPLCSAITFLPGDPLTCHLHKRPLCLSDTQSLEVRPGAQYFDVSDPPAALAAAGCETPDRCSPECCPICPPPGSIPPVIAYQCVNESCSVRSDFYRHRNYIYLPKWQEIATDGRLAVRKHRSPETDTLRLKVRVSKIAPVTLKMLKYSSILGIETMSGIDALNIGTDGNTGIRLEQETSSHVVLSGTDPILSTTEWFHIAIIWTSNRCSIYGEDETTELYQFTHSSAVVYKNLLFSSPLGVTSRWRMEQGMLDEVLMNRDGVDGDPQHTLFSEGAFLRVNAGSSYNFSFLAAAWGDLWIEFRETYMWQTDKVLRIMISPRSVTVSVSSASGGYSELSRKPLAGLHFSLLRKIIVSLIGTAVRVAIPAAGEEAELQIQRSLVKINYVGVGCDKPGGAWVKFGGGEPGWSTLGWKENGHGYSTGSNLV